MKVFWFSTRKGVLCVGPPPALLRLLSGERSTIFHSTQNSLERRRLARLSSAVELLRSNPPPPAVQSKKSLCDITEGTIPLPGWHQQLVTGLKEISLGDLRIISQRKYVTNAWDVKQASRRSDKADQVFCSKLQTKG